jgi:coenzyme F420 hydrogenase subunit beta
MDSSKRIEGQKELRERVLETGLCTNCGACVNLCPYFAYYQDNTVIIDQCDREEGRCYAFCPRTPTDLQSLRENLGDPADFTAELGALKEFYMTRAVDRQVRESAQHGGTVSTLISLALKEGLIDAAVLAEDRGNFLAEGIAVREASEVKRRGKSKFVVSPTVATFNKISKEGPERIGVVATPCQALALAKMRLKPFPAKESNIGKLRLVVGLFCGWALSWRDLKSLVQKNISEDAVIGLDIPPSKHHSLEIHTPNGIREISLDEVMPSVRKACNYCFDMTAEFSDISVGSARCPEGWEVARGWNQVIIRTQIGLELMELARSRGLLEFRDIPAGNLERLKKASANKKRTAIKNLIEKSGNPSDLLYLDCHDPVLRSLVG